MKNKLLYILPLLLALAGGCIHEPKITPTPINIPSGTFEGKFTLYHVHVKTGITDSLSVNINLSLETATGFKVTGDTSTLHAGSYGSYLVNGPSGLITFSDVTAPLNGPTAKVHLNGLYGYRFDGANLQIAANDQRDTLVYYYRVTKTGN